jgi:hypothetical protein
VHNQLTGAIRRAQDSAAQHSYTSAEIPRVEIADREVQDQSTLPPVSSCGQAPLGFCALNACPGSRRCRDAHVPRTTCCTVKIPQLQPGPSGSAPFLNGHSERYSVESVLHGFLANVDASIRTYSWQERTVPCAATDGAMPRWFSRSHRHWRRGDALLGTALGERAPFRPLDGCRGQHRVVVIAGMSKAAGLWCPVFSGVFVPRAWGRLRSR